MGYYRRYTGSRRRKKRHILLGMLLLLLVLALAAGGLWLYSRRADLPEWLHFPFREPASSDQQEQPGEQDGKAPPADPAEEDFDLTIEDPEPPVPDTSETPSAAPIFAQYAEGAALLEDYAAVMTDLRDSGLQQLALLVKDETGASLLPDGSAEQGAVSEQAETFAALLSDANRAAAEAPVAILPALRDNLRPRTLYRSSALRVGSGATWLDRDYSAWFDPSGKDTASCLLAQLAACEAQGFCQVVLTDFQFPTVGKTQLINLSDTPSKTAALTELARQLSEGTALPLGLLLTDHAAQDLLDSEAGQDVMELAQYFDVLYVDTAASDADLSALRHALAETDCRLGLLAPAGSARSDETLDVIVKQP